MNKFENLEFSKLKNKYQLIFMVKIKFFGIFYMETIQLYDSMSSIEYHDDNHACFRTEIESN